MRGMYEFCSEVLRTRALILFVGKRKSQAKNAHIKVMTNRELKDEIR